MSVPPATRAVAVHQVAAHGPFAHAQHQRPPSSPYTPAPHELKAGPKNRLILALRSGVDEEVDWALPRLVLASFDRPEAFLLDAWPDAVAALLEWPKLWLDDLEREAAYDQLVRGGPEAAATKTPEELFALGAMPRWTQEPAVLERTVNSLHILRNASFVSANGRHLGSRGMAVKLILRFFNLPHAFLLEVIARSPEPVHHLLTILHNVYNHLHNVPPVLKLLTEQLPALAMDTRDMGVLNAVLPILITTFGVPSFPTAPDAFVRHMLYFVTLRAPENLLQLVLDLLAATCHQSQYARIVLSDESFPAHLKTLVSLLEYGGQLRRYAWDPAPPYRSREAVNPASGYALTEQASRRRKTQREEDQTKMELFGGPGVYHDVGDTAPTLSPLIRRDLYKMSEPKRSIAWMHETFVYSSHAQLLQVTFWHAYRDFFSNPATMEQLLSASEVIKNVTVAFPAAQAKLWTDERGETKFVIAGMGFRKGTTDHDRFLCGWRGCQQPSGATNPGQLLDHVQKQHLSPHPSSCTWGSCEQPGFTLSHLLTHLPLAQPASVPDTVSVDGATSGSFLSTPVITRRAPPPLPPSQKLHITGQQTSVDSHRNPTGVAFLAALVIRGLARSLRSELAAVDCEDIGMSDEQRRMKKKHLAEDRFGLPIPASVLREEEEEEDKARDQTEAAMTDVERARARAAFRAVENSILEVVNTNFSGLSLYLADAFGW